ncbi:MAG: hypothetical protein Q9199_008099 [Rusavskia elegans]
MMRLSLNELGDDDEVRITRIHVGRQQLEQDGDHAQDEQYEEQIEEEPSPGDGSDGGSSVVPLEHEEDSGDDDDSFERLSQFEEEQRLEEYRLEEQL